MKKIYKKKMADSASLFPLQHMVQLYSTSTLLLASIAAACSVAKNGSHLQGSRNASGIHAIIARTS